MTWKSHQSNLYSGFQIIGVMTLYVYVFELTTLFDTKLSMLVFEKTTILLVTCSFLFVFSLQ